MQLIPWQLTKPFPRWAIAIFLSAGIILPIALYHWFSRHAQPLDADLPTVIAQWQPLTIQVQANGVVQAKEKANLSPQEAGRIMHLYAHEGDQVVAGQVIALMDNVRLQSQVNQYRAAVNRAKLNLSEKLHGNRPEEISQSEFQVKAAAANVDQARIGLRQAEETFSRYRSLAENGAISQLELNQYKHEAQQQQANLTLAQAQLQAQQQVLLQVRHGARPEEIAQAQATVAEAEAQWQSYQTQLSETLVRAPFSGTITRQFAQAGDFVTPTPAATSSEGSPSTSIAELSRGLEIEARVPEASIAKIQIGQRVKVELDVYPGQLFTGRVNSIAPAAIKQENVTYFKVGIVLVKPGRPLKVGMNARLVLQVAQVQKALVIPLAAVITQKDGTTGVLLQRQDQAYFQPIKVGQVTSDQIQVLQGLRSGERVLLSPPTNQPIAGVDTISF